MARGKIMNFTGIAASFLFAIMSSLVAEPIVIVADGKAIACIVVSSAPKPDERYAAEELQAYIKKISQVQLQITDKLQEVGKPYISVGNTGFLDISTTMTPEESEAGSFVLKTKDNGLYIQGGTPRGTLLAYMLFWKSLAADSMHQEKTER